MLRKSMADGSPAQSPGGVLRFYASGQKMNPSKPVRTLQQACAVGSIEHRLNARLLPQAHIRRRDIQG
jgi:hypothetical protein